ncbi:hypothetical protein HDV00_007486 [Rhizophlyctis rosea]|nr:hypothetical protein HDV00_007486 [Rhizophlyctis rosea]
MPVDAKPFLTSIIPVTPDAPYADGFWKGNCTYAQLTERGAEQMWALGKSLAREYGEFLEGDLKDIHARTTDNSRTIQSISHLLHALKTHLPPSNTSTSTTNPFPLHMHQPNLETMHPDPQVCPALSTLFPPPLGRDLEWDKHQLKSLHLRMALDRIFGWTSFRDNYRAFDQFWDVVAARACHGMDMPCARETTSCGNEATKHCDLDKCLTPAMFTQIQQLSQWEFERLYFHGPLSERYNNLAIGGFLPDLLHPFKYYPTNQINPPPKLSLYSAHDSTLGSLLAILGPPMTTEQRLWPPYASNLVMEIWKGGEGHYVVRVRYDGKVLRSEWCEFGGGCELGEFVARLERFVPEDYVKACAV